MDFFPKFLYINIGEAIFNGPKRCQDANWAGIIWSRDVEDLEIIIETEASSWEIMNSIPTAMKPVFHWSRLTVCGR